MQGPSRRQVCEGAALAGFSWALAACVGNDQPLPAVSGPRESPGGAGPLGLADFRNGLGSTFILDVKGAPRPLQLVSVHDHGPPVRGPHPRGECFTLILEAPANLPVIATATYPAAHPALGPFALFLVSHLAPGRDRPLYTATFSRI
jgi:hypothetical protein